MSKKLIFGLAVAAFSVAVYSANSNRLFNSQDERDCISELEASLKSPSSLSLVDIWSYGSGSDSIVDIEYDADNSFGASIRSRYICKGTAKERADKALTDSERALADSERALEMALTR